MGSRLGGVLFRFPASWLIRPFVYLFKIMYRVPAAYKVLFQMPRTKQRMIALIQIIKPVTCLVAAMVPSMF